MVAFALVIPFAGTALAQTVTGISVTPESDTAPAGTCNAFTVTLTEQTDAQDQNPGAEGETVDIRVTDADADDNGTGTNQGGGANESDVEFCQPTAQATGVEESGPNPQTADEGDVDAPQTGQTGGFTSNESEGTQGNDNTTTQIQGEAGPTDENGQVTFGILSDEQGTFSVLVFFDDDDDEQPAGDFTDSATKTFTAGFQTGNEAVEELDCEPEEESNPEGDTFEFTCTATDENGNPVSGATVSFDVTEGPNAEEEGIQQCNGTTDTNDGTTPPDDTEFGEVECDFTDEDEEDDTPESGSTTNSEPGTDTIVAFVTQTPGTNQTGTPGPDSFEPQDTIEKTFVGDANNIECTPDEGTATSGDIVEITCTVTSEEGEPIPGIEVDFTESGAGTFRETGDQTETTDEDGEVSVEIQTGQSEEGTITVTGTIQGAATNSEFESNCINGEAEEGSGADCSDTATVTVTEEGDPDPVEPECSDGVDNDDDGRIDFPEDRQCRDSEDDSERDIGGRFNSTITIRYDGNDTPPAFKGAIASERDACTRGRTVVLKKRREGRDRVVASDTSNRRGNYSITRRRARGRFFTVVRRQTKTSNSGATLVCLRDTSVTIRVRSS